VYPAPPRRFSLSVQLKRDALCHFQPFHMVGCGNQDGEVNIFRRPLWQFPFGEDRESEPPSVGGESRSGALKQAT
jgi:hypothetical protein